MYKHEESALRPILGCLGPKLWTPEKAPSAPFALSQSVFFVKGDLRKCHLLQKNGLRRVDFRNKIAKMCLQKRTFRNKSRGFRNFVGQILANNWEP